MRPSVRTQRARRWGRVLCSLGIALVVLLVAASPAAPQSAPAPSAATPDEAHDPVRQAQELFAAGRYAEGRALLVDASTRWRGQHREYGRVLLALGAFYEQYVGDYRRVDGYLREIDNLSLEPDASTVLEARAMHARLEAFHADWAQENAVLARAAAPEQNRQALRQRAEQLAALVASRPDYPRIAAAYHYLAESYLRLDDYPRAYRTFGVALGLRPAIDFSLPTTRLRSEALEKWARRDLSRGSRAVLVSLLVLGAVLLGRTKPWQWLGLKHLLGLGALLGAWWLCFRLLVWLLASTIPHDLSSLPAPIYLLTSVGTPLSGSLDALFRHGMVGTAGAFVIAAVTTRLRPRWTAIFAGGAATLLLFGCLMTQFVLGQSSAAFQPADHGTYRHLRGAFLYPLSDGQEPFMLTDPLHYCGFQDTIEVMDEPETKRWFRQYAEKCRSQ